MTEFEIFKKKYEVIQILNEINNNLEERLISIARDESGKKNEEEIQKRINQRNYNLEFNHLKKFSQMNHDKYIEHIESKDEFGLVDRCIFVTEYYEDGDLSSIKEIEFKDIINLFLKMLINLKEFQNVIIHRDIKPENIFFRKFKNNGKIELDCYLGDYGSAQTLYTQNKSTLIGTNQYIAPEVIEKKGHTNLIDIYSLGKTLLNLSKRNTGFVYNRIYLKLFEMMTNPFETRPNVNQLIEFMCRHHENLKYTLLISDFLHRDSNKCLNYLKEKLIAILDNKTNPLEKIHIDMEFQGKTYHCNGVLRLEYLRNEYILENYPINNYNNNNNSNNNNNDDNNEGEVVQVIELVSTDEKHYSLLEGHINLSESPILNSLSFHDFKVIRGTDPIMHFNDINTSTSNTISTTEEEEKEEEEKKDNPKHQNDPQDKQNENNQIEQEDK
ncbi:hypothetical protein ACTFIR_009298 [Dictyostelium discoideum]